MTRKLVDNLCSDWHFDIDNLEHLVFEVNCKSYTRKIYDCSDTTTAYIIFKGEKYYFEYPQEEDEETMKKAIFNTKFVSEPTYKHNGETVDIVKLYDVFTLVKFADGMEAEVYQTELKLL